MHRLLQFLPDLAAPSRREAALRDLSAQGVDAGAGGATLAQAVLRVLDDPRLAPLFGEKSIAEARIAARLHKPGRRLCRHCRRHRPAGGNAGVGLAGRLQDRRAAPEPAGLCRPARAVSRRRRAALSGQERPLLPDFHRRSARRGNPGSQTRRGAGGRRSNGLQAEIRRCLNSADLIARRRRLPETCGQEEAIDEIIVRKNCSRRRRCCWAPAPGPGQGNAGRQAAIRRRHGDRRGLSPADRDGAGGHDAPRQGVRRPSRSRYPRRQGQSQWFRATATGFPISSSNMQLTKEGSDEKRARRFHADGRRRRPALWRQRQDDGPGRYKLEAAYRAARRQSAQPFRPPCRQGDRRRSVVPAFRRGITNSLTPARARRAPIEMKSAAFLLVLALRSRRGFRAGARGERGEPSASNSTTARSSRVGWKCRPTPRCEIELVNKGQGAGRIRKQAIAQGERCWRPARPSPLVIRELDPGEYDFFDDFHPDAPPAVLVAKCRRVSELGQYGNVVFIVWRESIEALLVIGILQAWLGQQGEDAAARAGGHISGRASARGLWSRRPCSARRSCCSATNSTTTSSRCSRPC